MTMKKSYRSTLQWAIQSEGRFYVYRMYSTAQIQYTPTHTLQVTPPHDYWFGPYNRVAYHPPACPSLKRVSNPFPSHRNLSPALFNSLKFLADTKRAILLAQQSSPVYAFPRNRVEEHPRHLTVLHKGGIRHHRHYHGTPTQGPNLTSETLGTTAHRLHSRQSLDADKPRCRPRPHGWRGGKRDRRKHGTTAVPKFFRFSGDGSRRNTARRHGCAAPGGNGGKRRLCAEE